MIIILVFNPRDLYFLGVLKVKNNNNNRSSPSLGQRQNPSCQRFTQLQNDVEPSNVNVSRLRFEHIVFLCQSIFRWKVKALLVVSGRMDQNDIIIWIL